MVKKLKQMAEKKAASAAGMFDSALAGAVKDSAQQIWLAGMGAFSKAQAEGGKVFEALVKEGTSLQRKTQAVAEVHPSVASAKGFKNGDRIKIKSSVGTIEGYCRYFEGTRPDTIVFPIEHGHWAMGRWAKNRSPGASGEVTVNQSDRITGMCNYYSTKVSVEKA